MTKLHLAFIILCCSLLVYVSPVYGCRYNVREVGFIDIEVDPYYLFGYVPAGMSAEAVVELRETVDVALIDTNIRFEVLPADTDANDPAMQFVARHGIARFPAAVLVSPDGQSRRTDRAGDANGFGAQLASALEGVLDSPTRQEIIEKCAQSYGVVLLMEGPDAEQNAAAHEAISIAIDHIGEQLDFLPKPIARAPELVVLGQASLAREEMLLWSMGLTPQDVNEAHAAVYYARGRWIGPLLEGDALNADNLTELLYVIGADCECGLDHRWLQGTMLPARWNEALQATVTESLGFDPESPMIKMEMVSIIRRGMGGFAYPGVPFGYREIEVASETPEAPDVVEVEETSGDMDLSAPAALVDTTDAGDPCAASVNQRHEEMVSATPPSPTVAQQQARLSEEGGEAGMLMALLGGGAVAVGIAGIVVFLKTKRG